MSRYMLRGRKAGHTVAVGLDRPLREWFLHVYAPDDAAVPIVCRTTVSHGEICELLREHADLEDTLAAGVYASIAADLDPADVLGRDRNVIHPTHQCFDDAMEFLLQPHLAPEQARACVIVHAICLGPNDERYAHAWVELEGDAWQGGIRGGERIYYPTPQAELHATLRVQHCTRYNLDEIVALNYATRTYGPWDPMYRGLTSADPAVWHAPAKAHH
jgi:hypothetical protein